METSLQKEFENVCNKYVVAFEKQTGIDFDFWVADKPGEVAVFGDYFVSLNEIRYVVNNRISAETFIDWYDYSLLLRELELDRNVNLESYSKGVRPYNDEDIKRIEELKKNVALANLELEKEILNLRKN